MFQNAMVDGQIPVLLYANILMQYSWVFMSAKFASIVYISWNTYFINTFIHAFHLVICDQIYNPLLLCISNFMILGTHNEVFLCYKCCNVKIKKIICVDGARVLL